MRWIVVYEANGKGSNRYFRALVCILFLISVTGCAHIASYSGDAYRKVMVFLHLQKAPSQDPGAGQNVCLLDPAASIPHEQPPPEVADPDKAPVVQLTETSFDFGEVKEGRDLVHRFNVRNVGKGVLQIKKVLPG